MTYIPMQYPQFSDIRVAHFDGLNPAAVLADVLAFIDANPTHRFINTHVDYFHPKLAHTCTDDPESQMWVEVTLIYTL